MKDTIGKVFSLGFGLALMGKEQMEKTIGEMVKKGEIGKEEAKVWMGEAIAKGNEWKESIESAAKEQVQGALKEQGFATKEELEQLVKRIEALEQNRQQP